MTEVVTSDVRLDRLPSLTTWPEDGGPFLTLPLVLTRAPRDRDSQPRHVPACRCTIRGRPGCTGRSGRAEASTTRPRRPRRSAAGDRLSRWSARADPRGRRAAPGERPRADARLADRRRAARDAVPAQAAQRVGRRGRVRADRVGAAERARRPEGPFGDHYGYYSLRHDYPVFEVSHLARRKDAIYPATVVGKPRQEDFFIGDLLQELLSPLFPLVMPAVTRLWSYGETGYHSLAAAVVKQRYKREAMASAFRILGEGQLSLTKFLIVLDREVDLTDFKAVLTHLLERTQPETDLFVFSNVSMDTLDYTGPVVNEGSKGVWLGVGEPVRTLPREIRPRRRAACGERADRRCFCPGCLVVGAPAVADDPRRGGALRGARRLQGLARSSS